MAGTKSDVDGDKDRTFKITVIAIVGLAIAFFMMYAGYNYIIEGKTQVVREIVTDKISDKTEALIQVVYEEERAKLKTLEKSKGFFYAVQRNWNTVFEKLFSDDDPKLDSEEMRGWRQNLPPKRTKLDENQSLKRQRNDKTRELNSKVVP